jgi:hypothetical protein
MLFPENPEERRRLWDSVAAQLAQEALCPIIKNGIGDPAAQASPPDKASAEAAMRRLRTAQACRISARHGKAVSPHFAGMREDSGFILTELLSYPSMGASMVTEKDLRHILETAVVNLMLTEHAAREVFVPLCIAPWQMQDTEISLTPKGLAFRKYEL